MYKCIYYGYIYSILIQVCIFMYFQHRHIYHKGNILTLDSTWVCALSSGEQEQVSFLHHFSPPCDTGGEFAGVQAK